MIRHESFLEEQQRLKAKKRLLDDLKALFALLLGVLLLVGAAGVSDGTLLGFVCTFLVAFFGPLYFLVWIGLIAIALISFLQNHEILQISYKKAFRLFGVTSLGTLALSAVIHGESNHNLGGTLTAWVDQKSKSFFGAFSAEMLWWLIFALCCAYILQIQKWLPPFFVNFRVRRATKRVSGKRADDIYNFNDFLRMNRINATTQNIKIEHQRKIPSEALQYKTNAETEAEDVSQKEKNKNMKPITRTNQLPPLNLLEPELGLLDQNRDLQQIIRDIEIIMDEFDKPIKVTGYSIGPTVIQFQVKPGSLKRSSHGGTAEKKISVSDIGMMERDLSVSMGMSHLSIQAPVPGTDYVGIDVPNPSAQRVRLRPLMESAEFQAKHSPLRIALGRNITGKPIIVDLEKMPHLLVAGTTNSGKSISMRSMAMSLIMNNTPEQLRLVMIDPKRVEFIRFNGLPHLLGAIETTYERSVAVLVWAVHEMKNRYDLFASTDARNITIYNDKAIRDGLRPLPRIVLMIDELAELMAGSDKRVEECVDSLAMLARAAGIHMILATQRPDISVITGKIKANIPARIALSVAAEVDSRVIMGRKGAEKLLGRGDMFFVDPSISIPIRVQGPYLADQEIDAVVSVWKKLWRKTTEEESVKIPWEEMLTTDDDEKSSSSRDDSLVKEALLLVVRSGKASAAYLQSRLNISSPRAARIINRLEEIGAVGTMQAGGRTREVYWDEISAEDYCNNIISDNSEIM